MRRITSALLAGVLALGAAAPAFADPPRRHHDREWDRHDRHDRREYRDDRRHYRDGYRDGRRDDRRYYSNHWRRGDYFDRRVHYNYVVVNDYNRYRDYYGYPLRAPGRGHYYVRDDRTGDILLIAAATGLIVWALNN